MDIAEVAAQRPGNIEEALDAMRKGLHYFHDDARPQGHLPAALLHDDAGGLCRDPRLPRYKNRRIFMDPGWIYRLSGRFSTLYFRR